MSISIYNSTNVPLLNLGDSFFGRFDDISQFAEVMISIQCNGTFRLNTQYSVDKINPEGQSITDYAPIDDVLLLKLEPKGRYFKLILTAYNPDPTKFVPMNYLRVQTIYKLRQSYSSDGVNALVTNFPTNYATEDTLAIVSSTLNDSKVYQGDSLKDLNSMKTSLADITNNSASTNNKLDTLDIDVNSGVGVLNTSIQAVTSALGANLNVVVTADNSKFASDALTVDVNGYSNSFDMMKKGSNLTIYGNCTSADTQLTIQLSDDNSNWFSTSIVENIYNGQDFCLITKLAAKYVRIATSPVFTGVMNYAVSV